MTYFLAHDIVSGGDGVVAVRWLLSCNLCCNFLFKCVVNLSYQHIGVAPKQNPVGLHIACELEWDPASHPGVHVNPVEALQAFLLANHSPLIIDHMYDRENAFVFQFAEQHISLPVKQIARQKYVRVDVDGDVKTLNATDEPAPILTLHCVNQD